MAARAIWKAVLHLGEVRVPVKLYSAIEDRTVRFRLLHAKDRAPVRQVMVKPKTGEVVPHDEIRRGYLTDDGDLITFEKDELEAIEPEPSREIHALQALPQGAIDHRWYDRPYYLGPDESESTYASLVAALEEEDRECLARWVMRRKEYVGALRLHRGRPMLISLRRPNELLDADALEAPAGEPPSDQELRMAQQLLEILAGPFDPETYRDEYRARVMDLIDAKREGAEPQPPPKRRKRRSRDLGDALEASLREVRGRG